MKWNGSWEDFLNFVNVFLLLRNYHPLEKGRALHLSKLDSPKWILRRSFLNFVNVILLFCNYLPWKRAGPFIWTNLNSLHPRMLCAKFGRNWRSGSGEEDENVKSLRQRTTDKFLSKKLIWAFNSGELKMGESHFNNFMLTSYCLPLSLSSLSLSLLSLSLSLLNQQQILHTLEA